MVEIREVRTRSELRRFVNYPNVLYKDVPQYIPSMIGDDLSDWNPKKNPAFSSCDAKCWLAWRDGKVGFHRRRGGLRRAVQGGGGLRPRKGL